MHILIVGATFSGKSKLAKSIANDVAAKGHNVLVFDPIKTGGWPKSAKKYAKPESFIKAYWATENVYVFIDEAKVLFDAVKNDAEQIAYQGRHGGRLNFFIGQRAQSMIPPNARNQCARVFAFKQSFKDCEMLADEYHDDFKQCNKLPKITFIASDGFEAKRGYLDFAQNSEIPAIKWSTNNDTT